MLKVKSRGDENNKKRIVAYFCEFYFGNTQNKKSHASHIRWNIKVY